MITLEPPMPSVLDKSLTLSLRNIYETLAISWPTVLEATLRGTTKEACDRRLDSWCKKVVEHARMEVDVKGREHLEAPPGESPRTFLVMSNHQSHYDIPVLFYAIGPNIRMIAKTELFRVPIFGPAIREAGFIEIDRSNRARAIASLHDARRTITEGTHVWIAPEGTRSHTGELLPFKKGGFTLALEMGVPILPITLSGTRDALPVNALRSSPGVRVSVRIHPPVEPRVYSAPEGARAPETRAARERLMRDVHAILASGLS
jgi:1-acyl-sn-glycerol-3-phosphate acyltransferase